MFRREGLTWMVDFVASKGGSAPAPPDPYATAAAQTQTNRDTAAYNNTLGSGNVTTPLGSSTFTPRVDPTTGATIYDQTITATPNTQALLDAQQGNELSLANTATGMLGRIGASYGQPLDTSGVPGIKTDFGNADYRTGFDTSGLPGLQGSISTDGLPQLYGADDLLGARQRVSDALYQQQAQYLDPQFSQREDMLRSRLANQGITQGTEAYDREMARLGRDREFSYGNARNSAITGGLGEMQGLAGIAQGNRGMMFGERQAQGNFANNARGQGFNENQGMADFYNNAIGSQNADRFRSTSASNDAGNQALQRAAYLRNMPLADYTSLMSGTNPQIPQFSGMNVDRTQAADLAGNINNNYNQRLNIWNAQQQSQNSLLGGLMGLGGALGGAWIGRSDIRLKDNIRPIGNLPNGLGIYEFNYIGNDVVHTGVMAQEVEQVMPEAVITDEDGYKSVNYDLVMESVYDR